MLDKILWVAWPTFKSGGNVQAMLFIWPTIHLLTTDQTAGKLNCTNCLLMAIILELAHNITTWQEEGNTIIILMDFDDNAWDNHLVQEFHAVGLIEAIALLHIHGAPNMHQSRSVPINGIFISPQQLPRQIFGIW